MASTHETRRRQRTHRTTAAHARSVVLGSTKSGSQHGRTRNSVKTAASSSAASAPAPELERDEVVIPVATKTKTIRTADSDDHLAAYFRQLAEHELLTPEDERELSQGIEDTEILTWERVFSRSEIVEHVLTLVQPNLETPIDFPKLMKVVEEMTTKKARKEPKLVKKLAAVSKESAVQMRGLDLDRVHIDAVVRELYRAREAALAGEVTWWSDATTADAGTFLNTIRQAHRDAMNLRDEFVRANLRLVVTMARRYDRGGMPLADLIQEGNLGLMHAVSRFDYRRGLRFSTYACWWIRHAIGRALADKARAVRIPVHMLEAQQQLEKVRQALVGELGRPPTPQELAKAARVPLAKLNQMHRYIMGQPMSLDRPVHDDDDRSFGDTMADPGSEEHSPEDNMTTETLTGQITKLLHHLSPIEADVLTKRFGLGDDEERTFREIGDQYHLSRERIRQIQNSALDKLKRALEREHRGHVEM